MRRGAVCLWWLLWLLAAEASALQCRRDPPDGPPLDAAEQQLHARFLEAHRRWRRELDATLATDPVVGPAKTALDEGMDDALAQEEPLAFLLATDGGDPQDAAERALELARRWRQGQPSWHLIAAHGLEMQGRPLQANAELQAFLATSERAGRLDVYWRRWMFRYFGLLLLNPEPELPERLQGRVGDPEPCRFTELLMAMKTLPGIEQEPARQLLHGSFCNVEEPTRGRSSGSFDHQRAWLQRPSLCAALDRYAHSRRDWLSEDDADAEDDPSLCEQVIRRALESPDWQRILDQLAETGCPKADPAESQPTG